MSFIPYQVDFSNKNVSKTVGFSKKRVQFKFGLANPSSVRQGAQGVDCRGSEHELVFIWSLKSGKRQLILDSKDIHFSESGQNGWTADRVWQHQFTLRDHASGQRFRCLFITQPKSAEHPDIKAFDLKVQGVSYFNFNKIYELGTPRMITGDAPSNEDYGMSAEERRQIAMAKAESLRDLDNQYRRRQSMQRTEEVDLLSFDAPAPPPANVRPAQAPNNFASSITMDTAMMFGSGDSMPQYGQPPPAAYGQQQPTYGVNPYGAPPPQQQPPPQQPYNNYSLGPAPAPASTAMTPYGGPAPTPAAPFVDPTGRVAYQQPNGNSNPYAANPLTSPSGQSMSSFQSYGSAPSFAQPPQQQQPQYGQQQQLYSQNPYGQPPPQNHFNN